LIVNGFIYLQSAELFWLLLKCHKRLHAPAEQGILAEKTLRETVEQGILTEKTLRGTDEQGILAEKTLRETIEQGILNEKTLPGAIEQGILIGKTLHIEQNFTSKSIFIYFLKCCGKMPPVCIK